MEVGTLEEVYAKAEASLYLQEVRAGDGYEPLVCSELVDVLSHRQNGESTCQATIKVFVKDEEHYDASAGVGPLDALKNALMRVLRSQFPDLEESWFLADFEVEKLDPEKSTESRIAVFLEARDGKKEWTNQWITVGISLDIIGASWEALVDSIEYKILKDKEQT